MSDEVILRPVEEDDLDLVARLTRDPVIAGEFAWFGWRPRGRIRREWDENGLIGDDRSVLMVAINARAIGLVSWRRRPTTPASHYIEMGIALLPDARGHGYGTLAQRELVRYLFAHTTVHRIEANTELENVAEQRSLEKAGFTREGVVRGAGWRDGAWRDGVIYGILRTDPRP